MYSVLGIVNLDSPQTYIEGLSDYRPNSAISILGRFRVMDFMISNMVNSNIKNIHIHVKDKPRSIIEHIGNGHHYNFNAKRGSITILHGANNYNSQLYDTDISSFNYNLEQIKRVYHDYVVLTSSYMIGKFNFREIIDAHNQKNADVTVVYKKVKNCKEEYINCDCVDLNPQGGITHVYPNYGKNDEQNISLEIYVMKRDMFLHLIEKAANTSAIYWFKDIIRDSVKDLNICGFEYFDYLACVNSFKEYYKINMELKDLNNARKLFSTKWPFYTKTSDTPPTKYGKEANVKNSVISNGCIIEGVVENCVLGREVYIGKNTVVKNCVIQSNVVITDNKTVEYAVIDKRARIEHIDKIEGKEDNPVYIRRLDVI